jgi:hypothetical protein
LFGEESEELVKQLPKKAPQQQRSKSPIIISISHINKYKTGPFSEPPKLKPEPPVSPKKQTLELTKPKFVNQLMIKNLSDIQLYEQLNSEEDRERITKVLERYD